MTTTIKPQIKAILSTVSVVVTFAGLLLLGHFFPKTAAIVAMSLLGLMFVGVGGLIVSAIYKGFLNAYSPKPWDFDDDDE